MRLAQKASGLLKGLRSKQTRERRADGQDKGQTKSSEKDRATVLKSQGKQKENLLFPRRAADKVIATTLSKRQTNMANTAIAIHEDAPENMDRPPRTLRRMSAPRRPQRVPYEGSDLESASGDSESEDEPDESVMEDMRKLEENFEGISQKYRLINRIGEGMSLRPTSDMF